MRSPRTSSCAPSSEARFFCRARCPSSASSAMAATVRATAAKFAHGPRPNRLTAQNPTAILSTVTLFGVQFIDYLPASRSPVWNKARPAPIGWPRKLLVFCTLSHPAFAPTLRFRQTIPASVAILCILSSLFASNGLRVCRHHFYGRIESNEGRAFMTDVSLAGAFLAGLISFLSPCVLPLVPGYISMLSGIGMEQLRQGE